MKKITSLAPAKLLKIVDSYREGEVDLVFEMTDGTEWLWVFDNSVQDPDAFEVKISTRFKQYSKPQKQ